MRSGITAFEQLTLLYGDLP